MDTIGLKAEDITSLVVSLRIVLDKLQEKTIQANTAQSIREGCSEDEARFRAGIIGIQSINMGIVEGLIVANNKRILLDLKEVGLLTP